QPPGGFPEITNTEPAVRIPDKGTLSLLPGQVVLEGTISYEAEEDDGGAGGYLVTNLLGRARIEVWDDTGTSPLAVTHSTSPSGHYSVIAPNTEPGGIDPYLKILPTDNGIPAPDYRRVTVVDEADQD